MFMRFPQDTSTQRIPSEIGLLIPSDKEHSRQLAPMPRIDMGLRHRTCFDLSESEGSLRLTIARMALRLPQSYSFACSLTSAPSSEAPTFVRRLRQSFSLQRAR
jgi:hypothetical protein